VFVAQRESYEDTWINNYSPFVSEYAADASASVLTSQEVCCIIELQLLAGESVQCMTLHTEINAVMLRKSNVSYEACCLLHQLICSLVSDIPNRNCQMFCCCTLPGNSSSWKQARGICSAKSSGGESPG